jgi:arabinose-5-phosphate isomerase
MMSDRAKEVIRMEALTLERLADRVSDRVCEAATSILSSSGMVVVSGVGKSRLVGEKISATLASTGTPSIPLDPTDAMHGDLGRFRAGDVLLALSNSGETEELTKLVQVAQRLDTPVIAMTGNGQSSLARLSDVVIDIGKVEEACPFNLAPTTSTTAMMALGDALAMVILEQRGFTREDFGRLHPAGSLGRQLQRVGDVMRKDDRLPVVGLGTSLEIVLLTMTSMPGRPGAVVVVGQHGRIRGLFTYRDLQGVVSRNNGSFAEPIEAMMQTRPPTVEEHLFVADALGIFHEYQTDHLPVVNGADELVGLLDLEDISDLHAPGETTRERKLSLVV